MRVLHILNELKPSGAEVMLNLAAPHWQRAGLKLGILSLGSELGEYAPALEEAGYRVLHYPVVKPAQLLNSGFQQTVGAVGASWDVIHWHPESKAFVGALALRTLGYRAMLRTIHSNFRFRPDVRMRVLTERLLSRCIAVKHVAISSSVQKNERLQFKNRTTLIRNWIDTEHYRPPSAHERIEARAKLGLKAGEKWIVSVGNGSNVKNYRAVVEAMVPLIQEWPALHYAQVGREHPLGIDQKIAKEIGVEDRCRFVGSYKDPRLWLWAADAFVMPSLFEGFGLAAAEALVSGIPCVFSEVPGLLDWREEPVPIHWCGTEATSIASALSKALRASSPREPHDTEALRRSLSPEIGANKYLELYRNLRR